MSKARIQRFKHVFMKILLGNVNFSFWFAKFYYSTFNRNGHRVAVQKSRCRFQSLMINPEATVAWKTEKNQIQKGTCLLVGDTSMIINHYTSTVVYYKAKQYLSVFSFSVVNNSPNSLDDYSSSLHYPANERVRIWHKLVSVF